MSAFSSHLQVSAAESVTGRLPMCCQLAQIAVFLYVPDRCPWSLTVTDSVFWTCLVLKKKKNCASEEQ